MEANWPTVVAGLTVGVMVVVRPYAGEGDAFFAVVRSVEFEDVVVDRGGVASAWPMSRVSVVR